MGWICRVCSQGERLKSNRFNNLKRAARICQKRIKSKGLSDKVNLKLQDYRDETGVYDGVASIEMFEAVGEKYWPVYFDKIKQCLKPGKQATLQIITIQDARWEYTEKALILSKSIFFLEVCYQVHPFCGRNP